MTLHRSNATLFSCDVHERVSYDAKLNLNFTTNIESEKGSSSHLHAYFWPVAEGQLVSKNPVSPSYWQRHK